MCSKNHAALKAGDLVTWKALKFVGLQITPADEYGAREVLELRDCQCGSTLSREVTGEDPPAQGVRDAAGFISAHD